MKPEQTALLQKAADSLRAAELLATDGLCDFAASRAYYAMFYVAEALLLSASLAFSKHSAVIAAFGQHLVKTGLVPADYHRDLIEAQDLRNVGDYDIGPGITPEQANELIARGKAFLEMGRSHLPL